MIKRYLFQSLKKRYVIIVIFGLVNCLWDVFLREGLFLLKIIRFYLRNNLIFCLVFKRNHRKFISFMLGLKIIIIFIKDMERVLIENYVFDRIIMLIFKVFIIILAFLVCLDIFLFFWWFLSFWLTLIYNNTFFMIYY